VEVPGPDGEYQPYSDIETESVQESPTATRSIVRTYNPGANGQKQLTQVTEENSQVLGDGKANVVKTTSNPDANGNFNVVEREVTDTTKSPESQDTHTTVYLIDISGKLAASMQIREKQERGVNGNIEAKKTTFLPDPNGNWQIHEVGERTVKNDDGQNRITDDRVSRRDFEGNVSPVSQVITKIAQSDKESSQTMNTYSVDVPGMTRENTLRPVQQAATVEKQRPDQKTTEQLVQQLDPGDPAAGLSTSVKTTDIVVVGNSSTKETITVTAQYPDGYPSVVSVETRESKQVPASQLPIAPSTTPR
jgi:hypothetical protein